MTNFEAFSKIITSWVFEGSRLEGSKLIWVTLSQYGKVFFVGNLALMVTFVRFFDGLKFNCIKFLTLGISRDFKALQDFKMELTSPAEARKKLVHINTFSGVSFRDVLFLFRYNEL